MAVKLCGLILGAILIALVVFFYRKERNLLAPAVVFLGLEFLAYVPGLLVLEQESSIIFTTSGSITLIIYELLYVVFVLFGMSIGRRIKLSANSTKYDVSSFNIFVFFMIGFAAKLLVMQRLGGIGFVLAHPQLAYQLQSHGYGIYTQFYKFMLLAILAMCEKAVRYKNRKKYVVYASIMILLYMLSFLIYTSRTPGLIVLLIVFFIYNFEVRKFNIERLFNRKVLIVVIFIFAASYFATNSRNNTVNAVSNSAIQDMVRNLSDDGRDMFVYDYFSSHPKWYGAGYLNIIPSLIPGVPDKPVTDDGLYLVNLIRGHNVNINALFSELPSSTGSVPFSTPGYMFANFGIIGIIGGGILMGILLMVSYRKMLGNTNAFSVAIYLYMIYSFGLSTGRMVSVLITIAFIVIFRWFINLKFVFGRKYRA